MAKKTHISINNQIIVSDDAHIAYDDRGFRFGDGVFETILVRDSKPYLWSQHMMRLQKGLERLHIECDTNKLIEEIKLSSKELIKYNEISDCILRVTVSRGKGSIGFMPIADITPTIVIETLPKPDRSSLPDKIEIYLSNYTRPSPSAYPTDCKTSQGLSSILARMEAQKEGYFDALQLSDDGRISELSSYNIFFMKGKTLYTPCLSTGCLAGITRQRLIELIPYRVKVGNFKLKHLQKADAVIATNSAHLVIPIHSLKNHKSNWIASDKLAKKCQIMFEQDIANDAANTKW